MKKISIDHIWQEVRGSVAPVFIELGHTTLKLLDGEGGLEIPLERKENSILTQSCHTHVARELHAFFKGAGWYRRRRALCAIGARGVSMRHLTLPATSKEDLDRVLAFQLEKELPLPPDELAWGYQALGSANSSQDSNAHQELLVVALKKEHLNDYASLLHECRLEPTFTLGALARRLYCPQPNADYAILDIGRLDSELIAFQKGIPTILRTFRWGGETLTHAIQQQAGVDRDRAEEIKQQCDVQDPQHSHVRDAMRTSLETFATTVARAWHGGQLYLTGESLKLNGLASYFGQAMGPGVVTQAIAPPPGEGTSAATHGLKRYWEKEDSRPLLTVSLPKSDQTITAASRNTLVKWAALIVALALGLFALRYLEPFIQKPALEQKLAQVQVKRNQLPAVEQKIAFLKHLQENNLPFVDLMTLLARLAPKGTFLESINVDRSGRVSFLAKMDRPDHTVEFRAKLQESKFFRNVVRQKQGPAEGKKKVQAQFTAVWTPSAGESLPEPTGSQKSREKGPPTRQTGGEGPPGRPEGTAPPPQIARRR